MYGCSSIICASSSPGSTPKCLCLIPCMMMTCIITCGGGSCYVRRRSAAERELFPPPPSQLRGGLLRTHQGQGSGQGWQAAIRFDRIAPAPASRIHASRSHSHLAPQPPDTPVTPWKGQRIYTVTRPDLWKAQSAHELDRILMDSVFICV